MAITQLGMLGLQTFMPPSGQVRPRRRHHVPLRESPLGKRRTRREDKHMCSLALLLSLQKALLKAFSPVQLFWYRNEEDYMTHKFFSKTQYYNSPGHRQTPVVIWLSEELRMWKKRTRKDLKHKVNFFPGGWKCITLNSNNLEIRSYF